MPTEDAVGQTTSVTPNDHDFSSPARRSEGSATDGGPTATSGPEPLLVVWRLATRYASLVATRQATKNADLWIEADPALTRRNLGTEGAIGVF